MGEQTYLQLEREDSRIRELTDDKSMSGMSFKRRSAV
jgi:hypothetical protein